MATECLIGNSHQHIAYINANTGISDTIERKTGYLDDAYIIEADPSEFGGEKAMNQRLRKNTPVTAMLAYNDNMAEQATLLSLKLAKGENNITDTPMTQIFAPTLVIRNSVGQKSP